MEGVQSSAGFAYRLSDSLPSAQQQSAALPPPGSASDATSAISSTVIVGSGSDASAVDDSLEGPRRRQMKRLAGRDADTVPDSEEERSKVDFSEVEDSPDQPVRSGSRVGEEHWSADLGPASISQIPPPDSPDPMDTLRKPKRPKAKKHYAAGKKGRADIVADSDEEVEVEVERNATMKVKRDPVQLDLASSSPGPAPPATDEALEAARQALNRFSDRDDDFQVGVEPHDGQHEPNKGKKRKAGAASTSSKKKAKASPKAKAKKGKKATAKASTSAETLDDPAAEGDDAETEVTEPKMAGKATTAKRGKGKGKAEYVSPELVDEEDLETEAPPGPSNATTIVLSSEPNGTVEELPRPETLAPPKSKKKRSRSGSAFSIDIPALDNPPATTSKHFVAHTDADDEAPVEQAKQPKKKKARKAVEVTAAEDEPAPVEPTAVEAEPKEAPSAEEPTEASEPTPKAAKATKRRRAVSDSEEEDGPPPEASESEAEEEKPKSAKKPSTKGAGKGAAAKSNANKENEITVQPQATTSKTVKKKSAPAQVAAPKPGSIAALCAKHTNGFRPPGLSRHSRPTAPLLLKQRPVVAKPPIPKAVDRKKKKQDGDTSEDTDEERERKRRERIEEGWSDDGGDGWGESSKRKAMVGSDD